MLTFKYSHSCIWNDSTKSSKVRTVSSICMFLFSILTRSARSRIVTAVKDMVGLNKKEDVSAELKPKRIERDNSDLRALVQLVDSSLNPFTSRMKDSFLYNISTGKAVSEEVKHYLLTIRQEGDELRRRFIDECIENPVNFDKPLKRKQIRNFESSGLKFTAKSNLKTKELQITTGIFGRICCLAALKSIDLYYLLYFPLTPVPLSLANIDGSINKTNKSQLMTHLEKLSLESSTTVTTFSYVIVDAMFFLHTLPPDLPKTYGEISSAVIKFLRRFNAERIDIIFDTYQEPSIKDVERERRVDSLGKQHSEAYVISGLEQQRPHNFMKALKSYAFKNQFSKFLVEDWKNERHYDQRDNKKLFVAFGETCYTFTDGRIHYIDSLACRHEEADTRMFMHYSAYCKQHSSLVKKVCIRTNDTDVFVIFLGNMGKLKDSIDKYPVFFDRGVGTNRKIVNINEIYKAVGEPLAASLPAFHAFTGSDFTPSFARRGKIRPFLVLSKNIDVQNAFANMGKAAYVSKDIAEKLEEFTASIYGQRQCLTIKDARYNAFMKTYGPQDDHDPFSKMKLADPCVLPPCSKVLAKQIERCNYIAHIWKNADLKNVITIPDLTPECSGWNLVNNSYIINWFDGEYLPNDLTEAICNMKDFNIEENTEEEFQPSETCSSEEEEDE